MHEKDSSPRGLSPPRTLVWFGAGEVAYLAGLDAVDQDRVWVPLTPPSAHDALEEKTEQEPRCLVSERRGKP